MNQSEFTILIQKLRSYAYGLACKHFRDEGLRQDVTDKALDKFVDEFMKDPQVDDIMAWGKVVITNSIKNSSRDRQLDLLYRDSELKVMIIKDRRKYPKVRLLGIENDKERQICLDYWESGLIQSEIATKNNVSQQYVSLVIKKYSK